MSDAKGLATRHEVASARPPSVAGGEGSATHCYDVESRAVHQGAVGVQVARPKPDDKHRGCLLSLPLPRLHGCVVHVTRSSRTPERLGGGRG